MSSTASSSSTSEQTPSQRRTLDQLAHTRRIVEKSHEMIKERSKELVEAINAHASLNEILKFYDADSELLCKNTPPCRGHEALRIYYAATQKAGLRFIERRSFELHTMSPFLAVERGTYVFQGRGRCFEGNYFVLWIKRDDWVIIEECRI
ncbi:hypothetical protein QR680_009233 [Steinernema hermaphroditum]|uniref:DUF4440 domain-containing protein n=1 Tax=Steinernema hermaphroditum TaxID=289476 RepID=A0AA39M8H5_9BILA|nr:hypothetical protein QR680_009233 [Steinernema hermaphroditum]